MKTMADISRIINLYELRKSYKKVARELNISRNTARKYVHQVKDVQDGLAHEILPKDRKIIQPSRVLTEIVRQKIHQYLESNLEHPRKQRLTAKRIWELLVRDGHKIGYTSVKDEVVRWKRTNALERCLFCRSRALVSVLNLIGVKSIFKSEGSGRNSILPCLYCPFHSIDLPDSIPDLPGRR